jgi:glyoxylase-like metal-dependent hydrolase (beta-lactamase superfamily II)
MANPLASEFDIPAVGHAPGPRFEPDIQLLDGARFEVGVLTLEVIHTPGHSDDHLCFKAEDVLFTGDHIMGGSSVMIEALGSYLASLEKLKGRGLRQLYPGHGDEMDDPEGVIDWYLAHRRQRHEEILAAIEGGCRTVDDIVEVVYAGVDSSLHPLAARSVSAHLALMVDHDRIAFEGDEIVVPPNP